MTVEISYLGPMHAPKTPKQNRNFQPPLVRFIAIDGSPAQR